MVKLPHWPIPFEKADIRLGLERVVALLQEVGNPHLKLPPVIHVAGTNGKGSTIAFMRAIFEAAGYKVHVYTSPHLVKFNERIRLAGEEITDNSLYETAEICRIAADQIGLKPTFFEGTTAMAFLAFSQVPADIVLIETGMGGRLDATNIIDKPLATIITSISFDHMEYLGNSLDKIAFEKAGIIKNNVPCVVSGQYSEVFSVIEQKALEKNAPLIAFEYDFIVEKTDLGLLYKSPNKELMLPSPNLIGDHQYLNAANAITAVLNAEGFTISDKHIAKGIQNARWPARLQKLIDGPVADLVPQDWQIWVDGAHNEAGAHVLLNWLKEHKDLPCYMIFGTTKGRDCQKFLTMFKGYIEQLIAVPIDAEPLSYEADHIYEIAKKEGFNVICCENSEIAITKITESESRICKILICGSLYLAGDVLFKNQKLRANIS